MKQTANVFVSGCRDCPMCHTDSEWPTICEGDGKKRDIGYEHYDKSHGKGFPEWCPLKTYNYNLILQNES